MVTYVLDSSAILNFFDGEAGADRVAEIIKAHLAGTHRATIAAVHWGEIAGVIAKVHGRAAMELALSRLLSFGIETVPATAERALRAALIKLNRKIPYADAFGVDLTMDSSGHVLVTADFDLKAAARDVKIEFLPRK